MSDADIVSTELKPGDELADGKYVVTGRIGAGAMGTVYLGEHRALKRKVAIKVMRPEVFENKPKAARRFEREARAAAQLDHRHSVRVLDFGIEGPLHYLIMEYVEGRPLNQVITEEGPMDSHRAALLVAQVCGALSKAHGAGIVHRDLKPQNIILLTSTDDEGFPIEEVKVCDFGIAKVSWIEPDEGEEVLTEAGRVIGTPQYMSPEQCQALEVDHRSDLYSVGCVLYFLVVGHHAVAGPTPLTTMLMHVQEPVRPPTELNPAVSVALEKLILWAMEKEPELRPTSAGEFKRGLGEIIGHQSDSISLALPPTQRATPLQRPQPETRPVAAALQTQSQIAHSSPSGDAFAPPAPRRTLSNSVVGAFAALLALGVVGMGAFALYGDSDAPQGDVPSATPAAIAPAVVERASPEAPPEADVSPPLVAQAPAKSASKTPPSSPSKAAVQVVEKVVTRPDDALSATTPAAKRDKRPVRRIASASNASNASKAKAKAGVRPGSPSKIAPVTLKATPSVAPMAGAKAPHPTVAVVPMAVATATKPSVALAAEAPRAQPVPAKPKSFEAAVRISSVSVQGSIPKSAIIKAAKRLSGEFSKCYATAARKAGAAPTIRLKLRATFDVDGRARGVRVGSSKLPGLSQCIRSRAARLRSSTRPDTGTVDASFEVHFVPRG